MLDKVKEQNTYIIKASFTDDDGDSVIPSSLRYRVDDITGGVVTSVVSTTSIASLAETHYDIVIPAGVNIVLDQSHAEENRLVTVVFYYGSGRQGAGEYEYVLENMRRVEAVLA